jgi:hypothetical protein
MPRKCIVFGCRSGYKTTKGEKAAGQGNYVKKTVFGFPDEFDLYCRWVKFANRNNVELPSRNEDAATTSNALTDVDTSGICIDHFEEQYIKRGKLRNDLKYDLNPIPTIHISEKILSQPSLIPNVTIPRKPPTKRKYEHPSLDETAEFMKRDKIKCFEDLNASFSPQGYCFQKIDDDRIMYNKISFYKDAPHMRSIAIDRNLHVKLYNQGNPIPFPEWFRKSSCKLTSVSMLENFACYIENVVEAMSRNVLSELNKLRYYQPQGRPCYSNEILKFALIQRYTSRQAYSLLLEEFPLPSLSYLKTLSQGGIEPIKGLKLMLEADKISSDCVLLLDEIYLQKGVQYHGGSLVGMDENGEMYSGVVAFMVVGLNKEAIPFVIKAC